MNDIQTVCENRMPPEGARILIAMSGGVDSSAVALILRDLGYECVGATLRLTDDGDGDRSVYEPGCGVQAAEDAGKICARLNIHHHTIGVVDVFKLCVIDHFASEYASGRTPNPCVRCNRIIKFGLLFREARNLGCLYVATGHYARLVNQEDRVAVARAAYLPKDQSYVLAPLTQSQLRRACFPLGNMSKEDARKLAGTLDVSMGVKKESQEICFVGDRGYAGIVAAYARPGTPGPILDLKGNVLGRHQGIEKYTVGQRRGLGISAEKPLYVVRIDVQANTVYVGRDEESLCDCFSTGPLFWGGQKSHLSPFRANVQIRYKHVPEGCTVAPKLHGASVRIDKAQRAVTPGQWAVFYDEHEIVIASGRILDFHLGPNMPG